jgi:hypothetical protein
MIFSSFPLFERRIFPRPDSLSTSFFVSAGSEIAERGVNARRREGTLFTLAAAVTCFVPRIALPLCAARLVSGDAAAPFEEAAVGIACVARVTGAAPANTAAEDDISTLTWCRTRV